MGVDIEVIGINDVKLELPGFLARELNLPTKRTGQRGVAKLRGARAAVETEPQISSGLQPDFSKLDKPLQEALRFALFYPSGRLVVENKHLYRETISLERVCEVTVVDSKTASRSLTLAAIAALSTQSSVVSIQSQLALPPERQTLFPPPQKAD